MPRRLLRAAVRTLAILAALVAVALLGAGIYLRTSAGKRFVLGQLRERLGAEAGLGLDAERLSGDVVSTLVLHGVVLRPCGQPVVVRAEAVAARYRLLSLLRGRPELELTVDAPVIERAEATACAPAGTAPRREIVLSRLTVRDGRAGPLTGIEVDADGVLESEGGAARLGRLTVRKATAEIAASRAELAGSLPAVAGWAPVSGQLRAHGTLDALELDGHLKTAQGSLDLDGRLDAEQRSGELALAFARLAIEPPGEATIIASGKCALRLDDLAFSARGRGEYTRRVVDPALGDAARSEELPGGGFQLRADGKWKDGRLDARFHVDLAEAGQATRLAAGAHVPSPEHATVAIVGSLKVPPRGHARLETQVVAR